MDHVICPKCDEEFNIGRFPNGCPVCGNCLPPLTFRPEEWRMPAPPSPEVMAERLAAFDAGVDLIRRSMEELDREDEIMAAVRDVARGS